MGQRRPRRRTEGQAKPALLRRLGCLGAALALAVQLLLPVIAMPPAALAAPGVAAGGAITPAASILAQASAVWGSAALCEPGSTLSHPGEQSPHLVHPCPICWAVQQAAGFLPPSLPPLPRASLPVWVKTPVPADGLALRRILPPAQPRGPPFV
jgi:hypothetical protein